MAPGTLQRPRNARNVIFRKAPAEAGRGPAAGPSLEPGTAPRHTEEPTISGANYDAADEALIRRRLSAVEAGDAEGVTCPRCDAPMDRRRVPPQAGVAYVRDRVWVVCRGCGRSAVVDRKRL